VKSSAPFWLEPVADWAPDDLLVFRNGILNIRRYVEGTSDCFMQLTPKLFYKHQVDFDFNPDGPLPNEWLKFLDSLDQGDDWRLLLQQIMGYCLWRDYNLQKFFMLVGPTRCGKGTITTVMENLVGKTAVCAPNLETFAEPFGLENSVEKQMALVPEAEFPKRARAAVSPTLTTPFICPMGNA
jgi:putative DNA primase/helicase